MDTVRGRIHFVLMLTVRNYVIILNQEKLFPHIFLYISTTPTGQTDFTTSFPLKSHIHLVPHSQCFRQIFNYVRITDDDMTAFITSYVSLGHTNFSRCFTGRRKILSVSQEGILQSKAHNV